MNSHPDPVVRAKITKARNTWQEVHMLGYNNRRKALAELVQQLATLMDCTPAQVEQLISQAK